MKLTDDVQVAHAEKRIDEINLKPAEFEPSKVFAEKVIELLAWTVVSLGSVERAIEAICKGVNTAAEDYPR